MQQLNSIQMPPSQEYKQVLVKSCIFPSWAETFPCIRATALTKVNYDGKKLTPTMECPRLTQTEELISLGKQRNLFVIFGIFYTFIVPTTPVPWISGTLKLYNKNSTR